MSNQPMTNKNGEVHELTADDFAEFRSINEFPELAGLTKIHGKQKAPTKTVTTIRLSPEVIESFKKDGKGWQTHLNEALEQHVATH